VRAILEAYTKGTRYGIGVDPADGLLHAGEAGVQLTWMDAKVGQRVVTPRSGKPVEVNALWIATLHAAERFARALNGKPKEFAAAAERARAGFERFWNAERGCCFDVVEGPDGDDASLRPNQIFAVALPIEVLDGPRRRAVVEICAAQLWTPAGLRSLAPDDPRYAGRYDGDVERRDAAYHQGTVWTWLTGPFVVAARRVGLSRTWPDVRGEAEAGMRAGVLGSLAEIADGAAPFAVRGGFAQAWSVAALLDAWSA
jgi:predicted glycogen debranching enzyme